MHNGIWFKDQNTFIKINEIYSDRNLKGIIMYKYNDQNVLLSIKTIKEAFSNDKWTLKGLEETFVNTIPVSKKYSYEEITSKFIDKKLINIKTHKSESLSLNDVMRNIDYLNSNNLDTDVQKKMFLGESI